MASLEIRELLPPYRYSPNYSQYDLAIQQND